MKILINLIYKIIMNITDFQFYPLANGNFHYNINTIVSEYDCNNYINNNVMESGIGKEYNIYYSFRQLYIYINNKKILNSYTTPELAKEIKNHIYNQLTKKEETQK